MRIFPFLTNIQKHLHHWESFLNNKPVVFDIHPNELIDESNEPRKIERRSSNFITSLLQDSIRSQLKVKNLGPKAIPLYESQIRFFMKKGYRFTSVREYCEEVGLLKS